MIIHLKIRSIKIYKKKVWLIVYLFLLVFSPPIIKKINILHILTLYALLKLATKYKLYFQEFFQQSNVRTFMKGLGIYSVYVVIAEIISFVNLPVENSAYLYMTYKIICTVIEIPICCCYLYAYCKKYKISNEEILYSLVSTGIIQLIIGAIMMVSPTIKFFLVSLMQANTSGSVESISFWEYNRRYFAFSGCMLDMFGWGMGIIAGLPFYIKDVNSKYLLISPFLLIIGVMNSTTTVIIYLIMLIGGIIKKNIEKNEMKKTTFLILGVTPIVFLVSFEIMKVCAPDSFKWFLNEIMSILGESNKSSFLNVVDKNVWYLPENVIGKLFGTGHYVYAVSGFKHSDIGYINMIWISGICGVLIFFITLLKTVQRCCEINRNYAWLYIILFGAFWIFEIKGIGIGINPGMACTMVIYMLSANLETGEIIV